MKKKLALFYQYKNSILTGWIFAGILILLIPMTFVVFNTTYSRRLLKEKLKEMSDITLNNIQYTIDSYLSDLQDNTYILLSDNKYQALEKMYADEKTFLNAAEECFNDLKNRSKYIHGIDTFIYIPERDYIITSQSANYVSFIYNSIKYNLNEEVKDSLLPLKEWMDIIGTRYKNSYIISDDVSYQNFGKPSLVYAFTNPYSSLEDWGKRMTIYTSVSSEFIRTLLGEVDNAILFIVDGDGRQLIQFGSPAEMNPEGWKEKLSGNVKTQEFTYEGKQYIYDYVRSDFADWYYVLAAPESVYFNPAKNLTYVTVIGILMTVCFGLLVMISLHTKNYRKISSIMALLPSGKKKEEGKNELDILYSFYQSMNKENRTLKHLFESRLHSIRKLFWLDKLKGRNSYLSDDDMINSLNISLQKRWALVSIYTEGWTNSHAIYSNGDYGLISFSIKNVMNEILSGRYSYEILDDGDSTILLFSLSEDEIEGWEEISTALLHELYLFFLNEFKLQLSIVVSGICEKLESLSSLYSSVQEAVQYQAILQKSGIIRVEDIICQKLRSLEDWEEYKRRCILLAAESDESGIRGLVDELFEDEIIQSEELYVVRCQMFALVGALLLSHKNAISERKGLHLKSMLVQLNQSDTWINMKRICLDIFLCFTEPAGKKENNQSMIVMDIVKYVEQEYENKELNITMISDVFQLSPSYLSKLFKKETGVGLLSYINDIRIRKAQEFLCTTKKNVYEIADIVGYTNVRSFQRNFTTIVGISPNDYRRENR